MVGLIVAVHVLDCESSGMAIRGGGHGGGPPSNLSRGVDELFD